MRMESHRGFANAVELRPLAVDDMASIRYLHTLSLKCLTGLSDDEVETLTAEIQSPEYTDRLMTGRLLTAWLGGELVGSAGWAMSARDEQAAEIGAVFVHPLFVRCGIGRPRSTERDAVANYVLANFAKAERALVEALIAEACDATEVVVKSGLTPAMNRFNVKKTLQT